MRCNDFDAHIDEMLSGILHPDANQHMRQCERCTSYFRARAAVQNGLHKVASATLSGPSHATDRAVMASYRRLQSQRAAALSAPVEPSARLFTFPTRILTPAWASRTWWTGAAAAAIFLAVVGSAVHLWIGVPAVNAPVAAIASPVSTSEQRASASPAQGSVVAAILPSRRPMHPASSPSHGARLGASSGATQPQTSYSQASYSADSAAATAGTPVLSAKASPSRPAVAYGEGSNYDSTPVTQMSPSASPVLRLATSGTASNVAESASSTWPGYSNLMYCDPVVCSGPMQVVHIKVPVGQVKPNLGQTVGNTFVNAEVVVGPDGVARAIRVAQ
jgi:hypothetical protein